jgi:hypothetical protein
MKILKLGSTGEDVKTLQQLLGITIDGFFGPITEDKVKEFQKLHGLVVDGIVGPVTWSTLIPNKDTSLEDKNHGFIEYFMNEGAYVKMKNVNGKETSVWVPNYYPGPVPKRWLVFHHTAGWDNPYQTVDIWNKDGNTIATEFVVGGKGINGIDRGYDGVTIRCIPSNSWAAHLTIGNTALHRESIGVELCNMGGLTKGGYFKLNSWIPMQANTFYTAYGNPVSETEVFDLGWTYRFHQYFHKYSDKQIEQCKLICEHARDTYQMNVAGGLKDLINKNGVQKAFSFDLSYVNNNPGIYTHGNVFQGKNDVYPDPRFVDMIMSL